MSAGLATRRALDRAARRQAQEEQRGRELIAGLITIAAAAIVGTAAVLIADRLTGLDLAVELIRWVRS